MRKKALNKDLFKEFKKSITRFLSIMLMIALGSFIFVGMYVTGPTMRNTLLTYADKYRLEDLTVTSPLGLAMEDELILGSVPGVEILDYSYRTDLMQRNSDLVVRTESLGRLPGYEILEGRLPMGADEIALDGMMQEKGSKIGDRISFVPEKLRVSYALKNYDFVIVGFINSPEYLMPSEKGTASIGDGVVDCFGVIAKENFTMENVSLARLTFNDVKGLDSYSDEYKEKMKAHADEVEQSFASRPEMRLEQYRKEGITEAELSKAENELARIKAPDYTIHDRYKDMGFYQFIQNSESMDLLSLFFPVFFFLIALLVSLTTMTRMVDEQRLQIGTLKALGYSNGDVIKKYLAYGSLASLIGSLIGIVAGQRILMPVIFDAYSSNFLFKQELPLLSPVFSVTAVLISLFCTGFVALLTTRTSLKENVAALLRPKAPKSGNRILLERFTPLWQRLSFNYKVTARNIFRYKKRMLMTILGVAGCTALIFIGFGIRDSVSSLFPKQYGELFRYDSVVIFDENAVKEDLQAFNGELESDSRIAGLYPARFEQGVIQIPGQLDQTVAVVVPEDEAAFRTINQLRERKSKEPLALKDGAVITEKIAILLGLGVGDTLEFKENDGTFKTIEIAGITENYAGHYLYMAPGYYEKISGGKYRPNSDYILLRDHSAESVSLFSRSMLEKDVVLSTVNKNVVGNAIGDLTQSLNIVVLVLVLTSSLLAIVVLYNLTNINVSERIRELSTIMVLGFYPREVTAYVYRETMILTIIGIFIGYVFGLLLHGFIVTALPPANVLFDPAVKPSSYILAAAFTFAFSLVVMLIMHRRLKRINMVEALKAVE